MGWGTHVVMWCNMWFGEVWIPSMLAHFADEVVSGIGDKEVARGVKGKAVRIAQIAHHGGDDAGGDVDL